MSPPRSEHAALVALLRTSPKGTRWTTVTEGILETGSAVALWAKQDEALFVDPSRKEALHTAQIDLESWAEKGWRFLSILDDDYPAQIRDIHQAPPFLFASGELLGTDPAIAVVGSRKASPRGVEIAGSIAAALASDGVTVLAGLAEGIDAAAHRSALAAGGRTVAIIGTGLARSYPAANRDLQQAITQSGLVLSQFWPDGPPQPHNFLMRNAVMSGYGRATVVVEAAEKSGARAQARMAVAHGRPVILTDQVVTSTDWAKRLIGRPGVHVANGMDQAMTHIHDVLNQEGSIDRLLGGILGSAL